MLEEQDDASSSGAIVKTVCPLGGVTGRRRWLTIGVSGSEPKRKSGEASRRWEEAIATGTDGRVRLAFDRPNHDAPLELLFGFCSPGTSSSDPLT
jgi:hypothetical protein